MKRVPIRGGNWNNAAITGVFALNLNNARSNSNANIGARPAFGAWQKAQAHAAGVQSTPQKDAPSTARRGHQARVSRHSQQAGRSSSAAARPFGPAALRGLTLRAT